MDDYEQDPYGAAPTQSSIAAPLIRALLFAALAFGIYALVFGDLGGGEDIASDTTEQPTTPIVIATETPPPLEEMPTGQPSAPAGTEPGLPGASEPGATAAPGAGGDLGAGVTAQVVAGADTTAAQVDAAVAALTELGYEVTESDAISGNPYPQTTVFATEGFDAQAQALVEGDERFTQVQENPGNLSDDFQIHILVGEDFPT